MTRITMQAQYNNHRPFVTQHAARKADDLDRVRFSSSSAAFLLPNMQLGQMEVSLLCGSLTCLGLRIALLSYASDALVVFVFVLKLPA